MGGALAAAFPFKLIGSANCCKAGDMMTKKGQAARLHVRHRIAIAAALTCGAGAVNAVSFEFDNPDLKLNWDTTVKYTAAARVKSRENELVDASSNSNVVNLDDGDRNFKRGLISNRLDLLSELDLRYQNFGARISGAGWYDSVYLGNSDNDSPGTRNVESRPYPEFGEKTRKLHGRKAELLDAFVSGKFGLVGDAELTMRAGRHSLYWGESLFFASNAIGGGMTPVDAIKALSVPNTPAREMMMPVGQVSGQLQALPNLAVGAYYQYRWEPTRIPGAGSYFSFSDGPPATGEALKAGPFATIPHAEDVRAKNSGQGGLQVRWRPDGTTTDLGLYAIRYHDKTPQQFLTPDMFGPPVNYYFVYPENITAYGVSASQTFGEYNLGLEISTRRDNPLVSNGSLAGLQSYARGTTWHANLNVFAALGPTFLAQETTILAEVAANYTEKVTENPGSVDPNTKRYGVGLRFVMEPTYRQVLPGLDLGVPFGVGYAPEGRSSAGGGFGAHEGGDFSFGLNGTYLDVWRIGLSYTHFYGSKGPYLDAATHNSFKQAMHDRNFVSLSVRRSF